MPILSTFYDDALRSAWRRLVRLWRPMAGWTLLVWAVLAALLIPLASGLLGRGLLRGQVVVGNEDLLAWALTPLGITYLLLAGGLALTGAVVRYAGIFHIITDDLEGRRTSLHRTALDLVPDVPLLFRLCVVTVAAGALLVVPLGLGLKGVERVLLGAHDINFYLDARPAEWRWALAAGGIWLVVWLVVALALAGRFVLALPAYLDGHRPLRAAVRRSRERSGRDIRRLLRLLGLAVGAWLAVRAGASAALYAAASPAIEWFAAASPSLRPVVLAAGAHVAAAFALDAVLGFLGFSFVATLVTKFYYEDTDLHAVAPAAPRIRELPWRAIRRLRPWVRTRRVAPALVALAVASVVASGVLLERVPEPRRAVVTAHRAGPPPAPENTLAALERSIEAGADYAEIDVQRTRDGVVVVAHDADLMRVAGDPRRVAATDYAAMAALVQRPDDGSPPAERRVATLDEFLERARGRIGLNIELKYYHGDAGLAAAVVDAVRAHGMEDEVVLMSLGIESVRQLRALAPDLTIGYVSAVGVGDLRLLPVDFLAISRPRASRRLLRDARNAGIEVHVWTVNHPGRMADLIESGFDGLITDDPALAVRVNRDLLELTPVARALLRFRLSGRHGRAAGPRRAGEAS